MIGFGLMVVPMSWKLFAWLTVYNNDSTRKKDVIAIGPFRIFINYTLKPWDEH